MRISRRRFGAWLGVSTLAGGLFGRVSPTAFASEAEPEMRRTIER